MLVVFVARGAASSTLVPFSAQPLFVHSMPVNPYTVAASSSLAQKYPPIMGTWPPSIGCLTPEIWDLFLYNRHLHALQWIPVPHIMGT